MSAQKYRRRVKTDGAIAFDDATVTQADVKVTDVKPGDVIVAAGRLHVVTEQPRIERDSSGRYVALLGRGGAIAYFEMNDVVTRVNAVAAPQWGVA